MNHRSGFNGLRPALAVALALLAGCGGDTDGSAAGKAVAEAAGPNGAAAKTGPDFYLPTVPSPCSLLTEAVARNLLDVDTANALPNNSGPESLNPRCAYRDGEGLGKFVSIVVVSTPLKTFSAGMPAATLRDLVNQFYGQDDAPYETADTGPGKKRFVATTDDAASLFVMTGLGAPGGAFDPTRINAELSFAVAVRDPARSAEARLTEARNLAVAYHANLINAAEAL